MDQIWFDQCRILEAALLTSKPMSILLEWFSETQLASPADPAHKAIDSISGASSSMQAAMREVVNVAMFEAP